MSQEITCNLARITWYGYVATVATVFATAIHGSGVGGSKYALFVISLGIVEVFLWWYVRALRVAAVGAQVGGGVGGGGPDLPRRHTLETLNDHYH